MQLYMIDKKSRFIITDIALTTFDKYIQHEPHDKEAGGIIMGRYLLDCNDIVVDCLTTPQIADRRRRCGFFRSFIHNILAQRSWKKSGGKLAYLGLWHTHPEDIPIPSPIDLQDWENAVVRDQYSGDCLFFIIVGRKQKRLWMQNRNGLLRELIRKDGNHDKKSS